MAEEIDLYEVLQVSDTAEPETINRVYRIFAQRYHPDNKETGNDARFREITEAYHILSNPEKRAQYDATRGPDGAFLIGDSEAAAGSLARGC